MIRIYVEQGRPEVAAEAFYNGPDDAADFEIEGGQGPFVVESGATDEDNGADGTVWLLLFKSRT